MEYKVEEYVVAFIDILGASEKIKNECENSLNIIHSVYKKALESRDKLYDSETIIQLKPMVRIFSDNIVLAVPTKQHGAFAAFTSIAILSGLIQHEFLHHRYLIRGGISIGNFFIDEVMLWGTALLDAYYIENNISIYPRVVVHPKTVEKLQLDTDKNRQKWIKRDIDGLFFVDYMQKTAFINNYIKLLIHRIKESESLLEETENLKARQKILWHNSYLRSKINVYSSEYIKILNEEVKELESLNKNSNN